ncbi:DUF2171 domain-containing protein [Sphingomonas adhaesiva]|uniref:DUF2171 domain-containing protein n=1 Tax=Sphingomonas adhaesiva TaxID=28212 RepID=UPI002FF81989
MGYERYPRGSNPQGDYYGRSESRDYGRDYGSGRNYSYSSARDYRAAGAFDRDRDDDRRPYGRGDDGRQGYPRDWRDEQRGEYGADRYRGRDDYRRGGSYGGQYDGGEGYGQSRYARGDEYHGSYASDGRRFEDVGRYRHQDDDDYRSASRDRYRTQGYGRQDQGRSSQGYDYDDRGFLARAGDEVRSWFGDEEAERRREMDSRYDERYYNQHGGHRHDDDYRSWRSGQIAGLDRDYDEYRQENRSRFENEFSTWRTQRQTQRDSLNQVKEHAEVVGSDGSHVGTVDKVRGDRIVLTKNDADAGGQHHSIPSRWIDKVEDNKVTLSKTADEAKQHWRNEENNQAMFGDRAGHNDRGYSQSSAGTGYGQSPTQASAYGQSGKASTGTTGSGDTGGGTGGTNLNRSFSGTY